LEHSGTGLHSVHFVRQLHEQPPAEVQTGMGIESLDGKDFGGGLMAQDDAHYLVNRFLYNPHTLEFHNLNFY